MTITVKIKTDNAAFEEDKHGEINRILMDWIAEDDNLRWVHRSLHDTNGNTVGSVTVKGK